MTDETRPRRVQRKRLAGWRKPEGAVYVGRGSKWGNPFRKGRTTTVGSDSVRIGGSAASTSGSVTVRPRTVQASVHLYRQWLEGMELMFGTAIQASIADDLDELRGKDLMCWCPLDRPCHADVLLELANRGPGSVTD